MAHQDKTRMAKANNNNKTVKIDQLIEDLEPIGQDFRVVVVKWVVVKTATRANNTRSSRTLDQDHPEWRVVVAVEAAEVRTTTTSDPDHPEPKVVGPEWTVVLPETTVVAVVASGVAEAAPAVAKAPVVPPETSRAFKATNKNKTIVSYKNE